MKSVVGRASLVFVLLAGACSAQEPTATLTGRVHAPGLLNVAGATVSVQPRIGVPHKPWKPMRPAGSRFQPAGR